MLLYTKKDVIGVGLRDDIVVEEFEGINTYNDMVTQLKVYLDYVGGDISLLNIDFLDDYIIKECDYCGKLIPVKRCNNSKIMSQAYINNDVEYPCTNDCCEDQRCRTLKRKFTMWTKYGVEHFSYTEEFKERVKKGKDKRIKTLTKLGKIPCSRQQEYLSILLNGTLNKYFKNIGFADIVLEDDKIIIEYDGSGHYAGIQYGRYTYEEKNQMDYERDLALRSLGYKIIRIESENDFLPSDEVILKQIEDIKQYFKESDKEFFKWIIPKSKKDKRYGKLREITEDSLAKLKSSLKR